MQLQPSHITAFLLLLLTKIALANPAAAIMVSTATIPELNWEERSDWLNVKSLGGAKGDGVADDTAAIQGVLNKLAPGTTIYFPPGTYRLTRTLVCPPVRCPGVSFIGHGRSTTLSWDGEAGGRMFWTNEGMLYTRYVGLTWDGRGKAAVGFDHASLKVFETEMRHQHEAYRNFTEAGIRVGRNMKTATAETLYNNCLFENCENGVLLEQFNTYDHTFEGCEFRKCGVAINATKGVNFYVRNSRFEQSSKCDVINRGEHGSSIRRCTSQGSQRFLTHSSSVGPMTIQDCHIDAWKDKEQAISLNGAPVLLFDCAFTNSSGWGPVVRSDNERQRLIVASNTWQGASVLPAGVKTIKINEGGALGGVVKSAAQSFLKDKVDIPGKAFDAKRDFGAKGNGQADDTDAVKKTIAAAREHGKGAIAYFPTGQYAVSETIEITGADYYVGGSGFRSTLLWKGKPDGTSVEIHDTDRVVIENIIIGHGDGGASEAGIDILQRGSGKPTSITYDRVWTWGMYQKKPLERGLRLVNLGKEDKVYFREVNGNLHFTECADATIYLGLSYEGTILIEGKSPARSGFIGGSVRLTTVSDPGIWIKDNQSIVMSEMYMESSDHLIRIEGDATLPPGRVTLQGPKYEIIKPENNALEVSNYRGDLLIGPYQFYPGNPIHHFVQQGDAPFSLTLLGPVFYNCRPDFRLSASAKVAVIGSASIVIDAADKPEDGKMIADQSDPQAMQRIVNGLDHLRKLGAIDLQFSHPEK